MPCAPPIMGECFSFLTPQASGEATVSSHHRCSSSPISGIGLSSYRVSDHTHWFVAQHISPVSTIHLLFSPLDIKADNIMFGIKDDSVFTDFEENELQRPVPRKEVDTGGRMIYMSQELKVPKQVSAPVLCDFGSAILGNQYHSVFIQPKIYRAPEVILGIPWTYSADIWNVGCMVRQTTLL